MSYMDRFGQPESTPMAPTTPSTSVATTASRAGSEIVSRFQKFYAEHPTLVKVLGTIAVAQLARSMTRR